MMKQEEMKPVICGLDLGSWTMKICTYDGAKLEVLTNEANFRQTPSLVAYTQYERMVGQQAYIKMRNNCTNTIRAPQRLIGLAQMPQLVNEQLKYSGLKYHINDHLMLQVTSKQQSVHLLPEQILMVLLNKVQQILYSHNSKPFSVYVTVPAYSSNIERINIKRCIESISLSADVNLIDEWQAIARQYSYFRMKELSQIFDPFNVIFIDMGYSKISISVCEFTREGCRLLDAEHLRFTGGKNMDHLITEFYAQYFCENVEQCNLLENDKAVAKLKQNVEKQRKILSANLEHQMNIDCLLQGQSLDYNMKRQSFQNLIMPVLAELASAMCSLKDRIFHLIKIQSVELIGGASRIPLVQNIVQNIFGIPPSKTLNANQALVQGATIYGCLQKSMMKIAPYSISATCMNSVTLGWNQCLNQNSFYNKHKLYPNQKIIFSNRCRCPMYSCTTFLLLGVAQALIYQQTGLCIKIIGYVSFNTPNKLKVTMDVNLIVSVELQTGSFNEQKFGQFPPQKWTQMKQLELQSHSKDMSILRVYESKNQYESLLYKYRDYLNTSHSTFCTANDKFDLIQTINLGSQWLENHQHQIQAEYTQRIQALNLLMKIINTRKCYHDSIQSAYQCFINTVGKKQTVLKNKSSFERLKDIVASIQSKYNKLVGTVWDDQSVISVKQINQANSSLLSLI